MGMPREVIRSRMVGHLLLCAVRKMERWTAAHILYSSEKEEREKNEKTTKKKKYNNIAVLRRWYCCYWPLCVLLHSGTLLWDTAAVRQH